MRKPKRTYQELLRLPNSTPVRDAKFRIYVRSTKADLRKAVPGDHFECVIAQSLCRTYGCHRVLIQTRSAWIPLPDINERIVIYKFQISAGGSRRLQGFDMTRVMSTDAGVSFNPPPKSTQRPKKRGYELALRARRASGIGPRPYNRKAAGPLDHLIRADLKGVVIGT